MDGVLSDEAWRTAPMIDAFTQQEPFNGQPATERTEVKVLYDAGNLYIGVGDGGGSGDKDMGHAPGGNGHECAAEVVVLGDGSRKVDGAATWDYRKGVG